MKSPQMILGCGLSLLLVIDFLSGCASTCKNNERVHAHYQPGVPGGTYIETYQTVVTITAVNLTSRQMTLAAADGSTNVFWADANFKMANYQAGEVVRVSVARELCAWFPPETPANLPDVTAYLRHQSGLVSGLLAASTLEITATVQSVDPAQHTAVMKLSDGRTATFEVRKDIDLNHVPLGTTGFIRTTAAVGFMARQP